MRTLYWLSAIITLGAVATGCEIGGEGWVSTRGTAASGNGDGGAPPQQHSTSATSVSSGITTIAATSAEAGSTAMTTTGSGPIPVPASVCGDAGTEACDY